VRIQEPADQATIRFEQSSIRHLDLGRRSRGEWVVSACGRVIDCGEMLKKIIFLLPILLGLVSLLTLSH